MQFKCSRRSTVSQYCGTYSAYILHLDTIAYILYNLFSNWLTHLIKQDNTPGKFSALTKSKKAISDEIWLNLILKLESRIQLFNCSSSHKGLDCIKRFHFALNNQIAKIRSCSLTFITYCFYQSSYILLKSLVIWYNELLHWFD